MVINGRPQQQQLQLLVPVTLVTWPAGKEATAALGKEGQTLLSCLSATDSVVLLLGLRNSVDVAFTALTGKHRGVNPADEAAVGVYACPHLLGHMGPQMAVLMIDLPAGIDGEAAGSHMYSQALRCALLMSSLVVFCHQGSLGDSAASANLALTATCVQEVG
jgi:hypothetical protein